ADESARREVVAGGEAEQSVRVASASDPSSPVVDVAFVVRPEAVDWRVTVRNPTAAPLEIGDLAIPLPINLNRRRQGEDNPSPPLLKHSLVAGHGSFLLWSRANSVGPYLLITPDRGTH